jgi:hypothetical protein
MFWRGSFRWADCIIMFITLGFPNFDYGKYGTLVQYVTLIHYFAHILENDSKIETDADGVIFFFTSLGP